MKIERLQDKILFSRIRKKNDKQAFIKAYDLYVDQIYRFVYFKIGNKEEAEDLSSAVFLKTWHYIQAKSITHVDTLKSLFYKTARNLIIDHYRKNNNFDNLAVDDPEAKVDIIDYRQNPHRQAETAWDLAIVETKLPELKDEYREAIILRFINEMSIGEMADILNKSKGNVRVLIYRALNALRELTGKE